LRLQEQLDKPLEGETVTMLDIPAARDRAIRRAIETGQMPNMDLIHATQRSEGFEPCFGRCTHTCDRHSCRWYADCAALANFSAPRRLGVRTAAPVRTGATFGGYRDGSETAAAAMTQAEPVMTPADEAASILDWLPRVDR
jgi:hypothetical protein